MILEQDHSNEVSGSVITNVDIVTTDVNNGGIYIRWTSPFYLDEMLYPRPYTYELLRAEGYDEDVNLLSISKESLTDTIFLDTNLNTLEKIYNYRVKAYDVNGVFIGTSVKASSVNLEQTPYDHSLELNWMAEVPWSINTQEFPWHYIYRNQVDFNEPERLIMIDSVNVNHQGYLYFDQGYFNSEPLLRNTEYCYYIETLGSYGNQRIEEPLINRSQIRCAYPDDSISDCVPVVFGFSNINSIEDCWEFIQDKPCNFSDFQNRLFWEKIRSGNCDRNIRSFIVYFSRSGEEDTFEKIANVTDTFFVHKNLSSFAGCYKIAAVSLSGKVGDFSKVICHENCPYYELPNVFTPNNDGRNDFFHAFTYPLNKCPRFVNSVSFKVYNRYGVKVYDSDLQEETGNIYINWDGYDLMGRFLPSGIYYFIAYVNYNTLDPALSNYTNKGWVHLIR